VTSRIPHKARSEVVVRRLCRVAAPLLGLALGACEGWQSALDPKGPQADALADLFWLFTAVCAAVWVLVVIALGVALARRHRARPDPLATDPAEERRFTFAVSAAVALTLATLLVLTGFSYATQKRLFGAREAAVTLKITGHQWWWQIDYEDPEPARTFTTANEIHIPVGEPVAVKLTSSDVIHSFWVPSLFGKQDLITGRENEIRFVAERAGVYRGQCAEFCGYQHAHMGLLVVAESKDAFDAWRDRQIRPAEPPADEERRRGEEAFLSNPCVMCHTVRGTPAGGRTGPDLTHIGSRSTIAAGTLPRSRGTLAAWIVDPQDIKPGAHMPLIKLDPDELDPLASYLEGLK
jgi:cytochrome c oxidase subunit II